jgi:glycopeptide antibiotics resistance protein
MNVNFFLDIYSLFVLFRLPESVTWGKAGKMFVESSLQHLILGLLMALFYPTFRRFRYPYLILILAHPFIIEGVQLFMPSRTADTTDIMFGLIGTLLGFCLV